MVRRIALFALPLLLVASACSSGGRTPAAGRVTELGEVELATAGLTPFDSCDTLLAHLRTEGAERVGPYGFGDQPYFFGDDVALAEGDAGAASGFDEPARPAPTAPATTIPASGTNNQEADVDEADIVKATAERLLVVDDQWLRVVDITGERPVVQGSVELPGWSQEILVVGDRVLALGATEVYFDNIGATTWAPYGPATATLTEVDVSDPTNPTVAHTLEIDGGYLSSRLIGETARVVVSAAHPSFPFVYPSDDSPQARAIAEAANRRLIEEADLGDWLPGATLDGEPVDLVDCASVQQPAEFSGFGFLSVLTVDLTQPLGAPSSTSVLADGQTVYASTESLYVATSRPQEVVAPDDPGPLPRPADDVAPWEQDYETALHRFDITGTGPATYLASGVVRGHLVDQFSMSEHEGLLRVATTEGAPWSASEEAASRVAVLETDGQALVELGAADGIGRTEQIYSVRFVGDTGYVVTFRQTDPLFVVDLSNPAAPAVRGELEIPGYSAYLHPLDDGHLLGIGQDATETGMTTGLQASVFDVTDPTDPRRVDQVVLPGDSSAVEWDHRAFLYWEATGQAVLPTWSGSLVLSVGPDHVDEQGLVDVEDGQEVRRNVIVGDRLFTLGSNTLVASDLATLTPLSQIAL